MITVRITSIALGGLVMLCHLLSPGVSQAGQSVFSLDHGLGALVQDLAKSLPDGPRLVVAVASLRDIDQHVSPVGRYLAMKLPHYLLKSDRFRVVVRGDLDTLLDTMMEEQKDIYDPKTVAQLGRLIGADVLLLGRVLDLNDTLRLHIWLIDTERRIRLASAAVTVQFDGRLRMLSGNHYEQHVIQAGNLGAGR